MTRKSRRQCVKCEFINDCETIEDWRNQVRSKKMKRILYNHKISNWTSSKDSDLNCPDYKGK